VAQGGPEWPRVAHDGPGRPRAHLTPRTQFGSAAPLESPSATAAQVGATVGFTVMKSGCTIPLVVLTSSRALCSTAVLAVHAWAGWLASWHLFITRTMEDSHSLVRLSLSKGLVLL